MGIPTGKSIGNVPEDRNVARLQMFTNSVNSDDWRIEAIFQDGYYDGDTQLTEPVFGTETVSVTYGEIKGLVLPSGRKVSDVFADIKAAVYGIRQQRIEAAEAEKAARDAAAKAAEDAAAAAEADAANP